jgi:hypothetical protein
MYFIIALSTLSTILSTFLYVFITRQWFKPEYDTLKYIIGWYGLKTYTKLNMYVKKIYKIKNYFYSTNDDMLDIYFISNGCKVHNISNKNDDLCNIPTYDFICYEVDKEDEHKYLVVRDNISKELLSKVEDIEKSNVRFLAPQIIIDKSTTLIDFTQNIYLINNKIFSRPFITWYMDAFHKSFLDNKQEYSIRFFDNKMDFIQMNSEQCVILGKDTYEIVKYEREIACEPEACETDTEACETDTCETDEEACETDTCETDTCETDEEAHDDSSTSEADESSKQESNSTLHITQERGC